MRDRKQIAETCAARILCAAFIAVIVLGAASGQTKGQSGKDVKRLSVAEAEKRIGAHIDYIKKRAGEMAAAFYYGGARNTLEASFKKSGVGYSMQYADSWGNGGIGLFWSESVKEFYSYHLNALTESLRAIQGQGYAKESDLVYLDKGMASWKQREQRFPEQFQKIVDLYTNEALVVDEKNANYEKYYEKLHQLQSKNPYPSNEIGALSGDMSKVIKTFDDRFDQSGKTIQEVKDAIAKSAVEHLFSAINESARIERGTAPGANDRERP